MVTLPHERRRALDSLPDASVAILGAAARALRRPDVASVRIPVDLIRALEGAIRHYPTRSEVDCYWREDEGAEIAALREAVREAHRVLSMWTLDDDDEDVLGWKGMPAVRRALEEK